MISDKLIYRGEVLCMLVIALSGAMFGDLVPSRAQAPSGRPVLWRDTTYGVNVVEVSTNGAAAIGWTAPEVFEGEPALTVYPLYLNGVVMTNIPAEVSRPEAGTEQEYRFLSSDHWKVGATNLLWLTARNETNAESAYSEALAIVWTKPRAPTNLTIARNGDDLSVRIDNLPGGTTAVALSVSPDLHHWMTGMDATFFRAESE